MRLLACVALILMTALAGCADNGASAPADDADEAFEDIELDASDETGIIRGVVVDGTIAPVEGVTVELVGQDQETTTNENGAFGFSDLEPGTYFVKASKIGFNGTQTSVDVEAGVKEPPIVRVLIDANPGSLPYFTDFQWRGFFTCSSAAFQICPAADLVLCIAGQCDILPDEFLVHVPVEQPPTWVNSELVWESTQPLGEELDFYLEKVDKEDRGDWSHERSIVGPSPLLLTVDEGEGASMDLGGSNDIQHRVFPAISPTTLVFIEQEFEIFSHKFYGYAPPEGWRFTDDPIVPPPPQ